MITGFDWRYVAVLATIEGTTMGIILWAVRVLTRKSMEETKRQLAEMSSSGDLNMRSIAQLRETLAEHRVEIATHYVRREDAVVFFSRFEQKLDTIWEFLHKEQKHRGSPSD